MPSHIVLPDDIRYHEDLEAELADERYNRALRRLTVDEVLAGVDDLIAAQSAPRKHTLYHLTRHVLRHGVSAAAGSAPIWPITSAWCSRI
jgi:hypothetical protein